MRNCVQAEEAREGGRDHAAELADLQQDAGLPLEELLAQYGYVVPDDAPRPAPSGKRRRDARIGVHSSASIAGPSSRDVTDAAPAPGRRRQPRNADSSSAAAQHQPGALEMQDAAPTGDPSGPSNAAEATGKARAQPGITRTSALHDNSAPATSGRKGSAQQTVNPADAGKGPLPDSEQPAGASMGKIAHPLAGASAEQPEGPPQQEGEHGQGAEEAGKRMFDSGSEGGSERSSSSDEDMGGSEEEADDEGTLEEEERLAEQEGGTSKVSPAFS